jgi:hypothetical protein
MRLWTLLLLSTLALAGCGGSTPAQPSSPSAAAALQASTTGQVIDALTGAGLANVTLRLSNGTAVPADAGGRFMLLQPEPGRFECVLTGPGFVQRQTAIRVPGPDATISLIPESFDLAAFGQMFRPNSRLQRWAAAPALVIQASTLAFTSTSDDRFVASAEELTEDEVSELVSDLSAGLSQLTADRLGPFASITTERATPGSSVLVKRTGTIVVARHQGLTQATGYCGYGRWATTGDGEVVGGIVFLDRDFERLDNQYCRSLRVHELGHALGYDHVTMRQSVMNSSGRLEPNEWDRQAVLVAFQRPPGNHAPDTDPAQYSSNMLMLRGSPVVTWGPPIH